MLHRLGAIPFHVCDRCNGDLSSVATFARFCPHCGAKRSPFPSAAPAPVSTLERKANLVLRGYANAMCRLGARYEVRHHDDEAVRCYGKASRLGNALARARLIDIPLAQKMKSAEVETPQPGTSVA